MGDKGAIMEAQAIGLTGDCLLFLGPKSEAAAQVPSLKSLCCLPTLMRSLALMKQRALKSQRLLKGSALLVDAVADLLDLPVTFFPLSPPGSSRTRSPVSGSRTSQRDPRLHLGGQ